MRSLGAMMAGVFACGALLAGQVDVRVRTRLVLEADPTKKGRPPVADAFALSPARRCDTRG